MFAFLRGVIATKSADHIELDVNGVGYEVFVPNSVHNRLHPDQTVTLLTYCHIREDAFHIFGFLLLMANALMFSVSLFLCIIFLLNRMLIYALSVAILSVWCLV